MAAGTAWLSICFKRLWPTPLGGLVNRFEVQPQRLFCLQCGCGFLRSYTRPDMSIAPSMLMPLDLKPAFLCSRVSR
jgi:hypothetical protein